MRTAPCGLRARVRQPTLFIFNFSREPATDFEAGSQFPYCPYLPHFPRQAVCLAYPNARADSPNLYARNAAQMLASGGVHLEDACSTHATANAHGDHAQSTTTRAEFVNELRGQLRTRCSQRMTQRNSPTVHVHD